MKIKLPGSKNNEQNSKSKPKIEHKSKSDNKPKSNTKKFNPKDISWREKGEFITSIINYKLIKISLESFDIHLPNNFKMSNNSSLEEAKEKAISLLS